ncbi:MAG: class I adenylate-forming enzyme family protein, partial [Hyphomicrobiaceae bacterium]
ITGTDRVLHAGAFNWTYTLGTGLTDPWANDATAIVYTGPRDAGIWPGLIRDTEATIFAAVPGLYRQILKYAPPGPIDVGTLRHGLTAGETLPAFVAEEWHDLTGTELHEALGMSELSTYISACPERPAKSGTVGKPQDGRCIAILPADGGTDPLPPGETGLLAVHRSDPALMLDYWHRPDETERVFRGDWFCGGDLASIDEEGFVTHHGRADDLMNAFGYRVSPMEVEQALRSCSGVNDVAVTEINVRDGVNIIAAFVMTDTPNETLRTAINAQASAHLADYKRPKDIFFVDALPRTANGKVRRSDLQSIYDAQKAPA